MIQCSIDRPIQNKEATIGYPFSISDFRLSKVDQMIEMSDPWLVKIDKDSDSRDSLCNGSERLKDKTINKVINSNRIENADEYNPKEFKSDDWEGVKPDSKSFNFEGHDHGSDVQFIFASSLKSFR